MKDVLGLDGDYVEKELLAKYISNNEFKATDLTQPFDLKRKFDLIISLEVAEHLPEDSAENFIKSLCKHGDIIVFSAAIPGQGGQNHINEQWRFYWCEKFASFNYKAFDILRPRIWNIEKVNWWYKQNVLIFSKHDYSHLELSSAIMLEAIHPELFQQHIDYIIFLQEYCRSLEEKLSKNSDE